MKNREQVITSTLLFFATFILLDIFIVLVMILVEFSFKNMIMAIGLSLVLAPFFAYLIVQHTQIQYKQTLNALDKLIKESLHEIKIPIATMRANAQMISKNSDEKEKKRASRILGATEKLENLYEELEYFISKEVRPSKRTTFDLKELILNKIEFFEERLAGWSVATDLETTMINADLFGFKKLIDNLIDNAIKYSKDEKYLKVVLKNGIFTIEDHGIGIKSSDLAEIYERYYQSNPTASGYGIGLAIIKEICDEHKIALKIESVNGTKISLDLTAVAV